MDIHVVTIATNIYIKYWSDLIDSIENVTQKNANVTVHVFTDGIRTAMDKSTEVKKIQVRPHIIDNLKWPEATLNRYEFIGKIAKAHSGIIVYIDSDMIFVEDAFQSIQNMGPIHGLHLVEHPGYWRPNGRKRLELYATNPQYLLRDIFQLISIGGLGAWEKRKESQAYVRRNQRIKYVCGGFWFGDNKNVLALCEKLNKQTRVDSENGVIAQWHDESHLNNWSSSNKYILETPKYCFAKAYKNLKSINPLIVAVDKDLKTR